MPYVAFVAIVLVAIVIIAFGRGYRLDVTKKSLNPTGLLVATSDPTGAQILVDGEVKTATNATVNLAPDWYTVRIVKEGYKSYEKRIRVQGEIVSRADAYLFPISPSLSGLTTFGVTSPVLSPDGAKLAYVVPERLASDESLINRSGVWVLDLADKPLGLNRDARQLVKADSIPWKISQSRLLWSPDSKEILLIQNKSNDITDLVPANLSNVPMYLLPADQLSEFPKQLIMVDLLFEQWDELRSLRSREKLAGLPEPLVTAIGNSMKIISFSPDEKKFLYEATASATLANILKTPPIGANPTEQTRELIAGKVYVYDIKEDRNYLVKDIPTIAIPTPTKPAANRSTRPTPKPTANVQRPTTITPVQWLPTSRHLLLVSQDKIEIMEYDSGNRQTIYAGPFWDHFVVPWTSTNKLVILTTLNPAADASLNLYTINLR